MPSQMSLQETLASRNSAPLLLIASLLGFCIVVASKWFGSKSAEDASSIPLYTPKTSAAGDFKKRWSYDNPNALREAYNQSPNNMFQIWTSQGNQMVLPARYVDELKMLPDTKFPSALRVFFLGTYLWPVDQWRLDYVQKGIHKDLIKHLPTMFADANDGTDRLVSLEFPRCLDWTPVTVYPKALRVVSRINAKTLIGNRLEENEEWIDISTSYTRNIFVSSAKLRIFPAFIRPVAQYFIPELKSVWHCNKRAQDIIAPILSERAVRERSGDFKKPHDSIEWFRDDASNPKDKQDPQLHALAQLLIGALSVNTTTQLITNSLFNLATYPEYVPILRQEINDTYKANDGKWTMDSMAQMQKLDSFIKETLRHAGHLTLTFHRMARETIKLSDGAKIPKGYTAFSPANAINFDPELYPNPDTFDGLRFYNLRHSAPENEKKYQLTSLTVEQMQFGAGRHACPGRAIAGHQVKLILSNLLNKYELKLKNGENRPKTVLFQTNQFPDPQGQILFKDRKE